MDPSLPQRVTLYYAEPGYYSQMFLPEWANFITMVNQLGLIDFIEIYQKRANETEMSYAERQEIFNFPTIIIKQNNKKSTLNTLNGNKNALDIFKECGYSFVRITECFITNSTYYNDIYENDVNTNYEDINYEIACIEI